MEILTAVTSAGIVMRLNRAVSAPASSGPHLQMLRHEAGV